MHPVRKVSPLLHCKALEGNDPPGTFEAIVSAFGNEDSDGEAVAFGAFAETLKGPPPPITYSHQWMDIPIGKTVDAEELDRAALGRLLPDGVPENVQGGLYAKAKLHVDGEYAIERAKAAYRNLIERSLREFSWSGDAPEIRIEKRDGRNPLVWLERCNLAEWGPCLKGANAATALLGVKSLDLDAVTELKRSVDRLYDHLSKGDVLEPDEARRAMGLPPLEPTSDAPRRGNNGHLLLVMAGCPVPD